MATISMTGSDTVKINGRILNDLIDGDCAVLDFPNELASVKTGKGGNSIYAFNETGKQADFTLRLVRGSSDDKFLLSLLAAQKNDFAGFSLLNGELVKRAGDGSGKVNNDTYILSGGVFTKEVAAKSNAEGDTEQSVSIYSMKYSNAPRVIE